MKNKRETKKAKKAAGGAKARKAAPKKPAAKSTAGPIKERVVELLARKGGATLAALMEATGWQAHSVRGFISTLQSKGGLKIKSEKVDGARTYSTEGK